LNDVSIFTTQMHDCMKTILLVFFGILLSLGSSAQLLDDQQVFTRKDSLRGTLTAPRACYDVTYYHLDIKIDPSSQSIEGSNTITFQLSDDTRLIQVDLFENMVIDRIKLNGKKKLNYTRTFGAVFINLPDLLAKGSTHTISIEYHGQPQVAKRPPWDGGFVWATDSTGNPWVAVTCQGTGASLWWPNKDHQSDEPDSMMISITVPEGLENISNGRLRKVSKAAKGWTRYDWFVHNPINNYNVTINIGKFAHFGEVFIPESGDTLTMDYYVIPQELEKAKAQFAQVKQMMAFFYKYFGPYPFVEDGYKLIQSPHLGMEHQSAVAYGNRYLNGYNGIASSEEGLTFDFIILHETAHEWWGNNITTNDIANMWVHESFGAYAEALYVEHMLGYEAGMRYINAKKQNVRNNQPMIGPYGVNKEGSGDMYDKGQLVLNTLRHVIGNDDLWFQTLKEANTRFRHQSIDGQELIDFISEKTNTNLDHFFDQYYRHARLPKLEVSIQKKGNEVSALYKWQTEVVNFQMPIRVTTAPGKMELIYPETKKAKKIYLKGIDPKDFRIAEDQYFVDLEIRTIYIDPRKEP